MSETPGDLLARFQGGDEDAFGELVARMGPRLKGYFLRQGADEATAEDLTQNAFLRVLQSARRYRPEGRLDAFFLRVARNLWIDHRRRGPPSVRAEGAARDGGGAPSPAELAGRSDRAARLRQALADLDGDTRELLELAVLQGLPYRDVAGILGIPVGTVKSRVFYALRRLREQLGALAEERWEDVD